MIKPAFQVREQSKARKRKQSSLRSEKELWKKGYKHVVCLDEAGRGPLAGPVVASAVALNSKFKNQISKLQFKIKNLRDSKKLSAKKRKEFYKILTKHLAVDWAIGKVSEKIIDKINIQNAAELAMLRAIKKLKTRPDFLIIDGNRLNSEKLKAISYKLIIKADEKVFSCACASILAKVARDRMMMRYHKKYPKYRFDLHKGYPTKEHVKRLKKYKSCRIHRMTFAPVLESLKRKAQSVKRKT